uniref:Vegetative cell wall protein gp1-like n=1 Tax=Lepisosteus oculatus TaxID=7918 RepID=W5MHQ0_LEPOC|nr:PREDICTED: vegetative cell wall protein gp1-like [Lepisosteus oculatus]
MRVVVVLLCVLGTALSASIFQKNGQLRLRKVRTPPGQQGSPTESPLPGPGGTSKSPTPAPPPLFPGPTAPQNPFIQNEPGPNAPQFPFPGPDAPQFPFPGPDAPQFPFPGPDAPQFPFPGPSAPQFPFPGPCAPQFPFLGPGGPHFPFPGPGAPHFPFPGPIPRLDTPPRDPSLHNGHPPRPPCTPPFYRPYYFNAALPHPQYLPYPSFMGPPPPIFSAYPPFPPGPFFPGHARAGVALPLNMPPLPSVPRSRVRAGAASVSPPPLRGFAQPAQGVRGLYPGGAGEMRSGAGAGRSTLLPQSLVSNEKGHNGDSAQTV